MALTMLNRRTRVIASLSMAGISVFIIGVLILHVVRSDLNPAKHMVSEYVLGNFGWIQTINFSQLD